MRLRRAVRIGFCGSLCLLTACAVAAPDGAEEESEARVQASALTAQTLATTDEFARAVFETFPNDEFAADYVDEVLAEEKSYTTTEKATLGTSRTTSSTTLERTSTPGTAPASLGKEFPYHYADGDTTCDREDDDEDGEIDEDCDFGPEDCPAGMNVITGTGGSDWIWGTLVADCILGYGGRDVLIGQDGNDLIVGGPGDDAIRGSRGDDTLLGGLDDDLMYGDDGNDRVDGEEGNDALIGAKGNDRVNGGMCHDLVLATSGTDILRGEDGSDRIEASAPHAIDGGNGFDACNGASCEITAFASLCLWDGDCAPGQRCTRTSHICVSTAVVPFTDKTCDGADDDCDGRFDEEYAPVAVACPCGGGSGTTACVDGTVVDDCSGGGGGGGSDATCDGVDDDCDAAVDEDFVSTPTGCGVGACTASGLLTCVAGAPVDTCTPLPPAPSDASCNAIDDDCSGAADEDYVPTATSCGVGACGASGVLACIGGAVANSCVPGAPAPSDATCNNVDDDCSGTADEDYVPTPTTCGVGACGASGVLACISGAVVNSCVPGAPAPSDATCNNIDDDCSGTADEDYVPTPTTCGVGACAASGVLACVSGATVDSCVPGAPAPSDATCNNVDDDCSGTADEDYVPTPTSCEIAGCSREGALQCSAGVVVDTCSSAPCIAEIACDDGVDNDADATTDCADPDCTTEPICTVQTFSVSVPGGASLWGAGLPSPPGGGLPPPGIIITLPPGASVKFTSITGLVSQAGTNLPADGAGGVENLPNSMALAGFTHAVFTRSLAGVFLDSGPPSGPPPGSLAFANGNFTTLSPGLRQIFFIGDGLTSTAVQQEFVVPAGATRLFLGLTDRCPGNIPGCFGDNTGSYSVAGEISFD